MNNYFKVAEDKIPVLHTMAGALTGSDLMALVAIWNLQAVQQSNLDLISCGELDVKEVSEINTVECMTNCVCDMAGDMLNPIDLAEVIATNHLAEPYLLDVTVRVTASARCR